MSAHSELESELLERLFSAPGDTRAWGTFLEALSDALSEGALAFFAAQGGENRPGVVAGRGVGVSRADVTELVAPSLPHPSPAELPLGAVIELPEGHSAFRHSTLYREVLAPLGVRPGPGLIVVIERDRRQVRAVTLVLGNTRGWKPSASDRALIEHLAPHLVIARRLHVGLTRPRLDLEALLTVFDQLLLGVILLDAKGLVSFANRSAAELLGTRPGLADPQELGTARDARSDALYDLMPRSRRNAREAHLRAHPADERPLQFLSTPLEWPDPFGETAQRFARAVFIGDPKRRPGDPIGNLRKLFGLTPAEARLAILLLGDRSLQEAAKQLGVAPSTARTVLKSLFAKTGTKRQASLVRLLLSGTGQVRADAAAAEADAAVEPALPAVWTPRRVRGGWPAPPARHRRD